MEGFLRCRLGGRIFGGAYTRGGGDIFGILRYQYICIIGSEQRNFYVKVCNLSSLSVNI